MNMSMEQIMANFRNALQKVTAYRILVSSPVEKVADLPVLIVALAAIMAPRVSVLIAILALVTGHRFRLEKNFIVRT